MYIATGTQDSIPDLLLSLSQRSQVFNITDLSTSEVIYTVPTTYEGIFMTNTTYAIVDSNYLLYVYNLKTNALLAKIPIFYGHYEPVHQVLYYYEIYSETNCSLLYCDLQTLATGVVYSSLDQCYATILHMNATSDAYSPDLTIAVDNNFTIINHIYGQIPFVSSFDKTYAQTLVPNYESMSFYHVASKEDQGTFISSYQYNAKEKKFEQQSSYNYTNISSVSNEHWAILDSETLVFLYGRYFVLFDLPRHEYCQYNIQTKNQRWSTFINEKGEQYLLLSGFDYENPGYDPASIFDANRQLSLLSETTNFTIEAEGAGYCSYYIADGMITSLEVVRIYNTCLVSDGKNNIFKIDQ